MNQVFVVNGKSIVTTIGVMESLDRDRPRYCCSVARTDEFNYEHKFPDEYALFVFDTLEEAEAFERMINPTKAIPPQPNVSLGNPRLEDASTRFSAESKGPFSKRYMDQGLGKSAFLSTDKTHKELLEELRGTLETSSFVKQKFTPESLSVTFQSPYACGYGVQRYMEMYINAINESKRTALSTSKLQSQIEAINHQLIQDSGFTEAWKREFGFSDDTWEHSPCFVPTGLSAVIEDHLRCKKVWSQLTMEESDPDEEEPKYTLRRGTPGAKAVFPTMTLQRDQDK